MRVLALALAGLAVAITPPTSTPPTLASTAAPTLPFLTPLAADRTLLPADSDSDAHPFRVPLLRKRQSAAGGCPANFGDCGALGAPQACCRADAACTPDGANHVACCPSGAACTGTLGAAGGGGGGAAAPSTVSTTAPPAAATGPTTLPPPGATGTLATGNGVIVSLGAAAGRGGIEGWAMAAVGWGLWVGAVMGVL